MRKFADFSKREKILILVLLFVGLPFILYELLLSPAIIDYEEDKNRYENNLKTLEFVQQNPHLLKSIPDVAKSNKKQPLLSAVKIVLKNLNISQPKKITVIAKKQLQLEFDNIKYKELMYFIGDIKHKHAVVVKSIHVKKVSDARVSCKLIIQRL
jgi:type II secretory pathway component PulM